MEWKQARKQSGKMLKTISRSATARILTSIPATALAVSILSDLSRYSPSLTEELLPCSALEKPARSRTWLAPIEMTTIAAKAANIALIVFLRSCPASLPPLSDN